MGQSLEVITKESSSPPSHPHLVLCLSKAFHPDGIDWGLGWEEIVKRWWSGNPEGREDDEEGGGGMEMKGGERVQK